MYISSADNFKWQISRHFPIEHDSDRCDWAISHPYVVIDARGKQWLIPVITFNLKLVEKKANIISHFGPIKNIEKYHCDDEQKKKTLQSSERTDGRTDDQPTTVILTRYQVNSS